MPGLPYDGYPAIPEIGRGLDELLRTVQESLYPLVDLGASLNRHGMVASNQQPVGGRMPTFPDMGRTQKSRLREKLTAEVR